MFNKHSIWEPEWEVEYYDDCDQDHHINTVRSVVLTYDINQPNMYFIKWAAFDKLLALEIIDIELSNAITCNDKHKLELFQFNGKEYKCVDEVLVADILSAHGGCGILMGTHESVWWRLVWERSINYKDSNRNKIQTNI